MHALLEALALLPGCEDSGSDTVYCPESSISRIFTSWTSLTVDDGTGDLLIEDSAADGVTFRIARVSGEEREVSEESGGGGGSSS